MKILYWFCFFSSQGHQYGAVLVSTEAGGRGEERPEGEKSKPRSPEVPQGGERTVHRGATEVHKAQVIKY